MKPSSAPRSLLIINLGGIGDLLLSTGAINALRTALPHAQIDLLTTERCGAFMRTYGLFSTVYTMPGGREPGARLRVLASLRCKRYDVAVNMRTITGRAGALKLRALMTAINARSTAGRNTDGRGSFLDESIPETLFTDQPEYLFDAETVRTMGIPVDDPAPLPVPVTDEERLAARALLAGTGFPSDAALIGVHPGGEPSHRWPAERFIELMRRLREERTCAFILTGASEEKHICARIAAATGAVNLAGATTTIGTLAALIEQCRMYIANDTGAMHVCVAAGTPGVFLFGPGHAGRYQPFRRPDSHILLKSGASCAPCERTVCAEQSCMNDITVDDAHAAAASILARGESSC